MKLISQLMLLSLLQTQVFRVSSMPLLREQISSSGSGLIRHEVIADDGQKLRVYSRSDQVVSSAKRPKRTVLLLHGRTWSSLPVYDLTVDGEEDETTSSSLLKTLAARGIDAYALDFRGFGETTCDSSGFCTPKRCVEDVHAAMRWLQGRISEGSEEETAEKPALLGWSQGALVAMDYAQCHGSDMVSGLVLFGTIYDPKVVYPRASLYDPPLQPEPVINDLAGALYDFTLPGSISDAAAQMFGQMALESDPIKAQWANLHEFNDCNPAKVCVPTMLIVGDQDPYASKEGHEMMFQQLGSSEKVWHVLPNSDHAAHLLRSRSLFVNALEGFVRRRE